MSSDRSEPGLFTSEPVRDAKDPASNANTPGAFPFEAMQLKIGNRLQVQPPERISTERCIVRLIGYLPGYSLLITAPKTATGGSLPLAESDTLVLRAFSGQNAFAFACNVQRVCRAPYHYLHLGFPDTVQGTVIRKAPRVRTKIGANVSGANATAQALTGVISNLSANGALLDGPRHLASEGDTLTLSFRLRLHGIDNQLSLQAVVRAIMRDETLEQSGTSLVHFGLEFIELQPHDQMLLKSMVYQKIIEDPQSMT